VGKATIPEDIRRFILTSIPSVPFLEALLLLRAATDQSWRADTLARRLYIGDRTAQALLDELCTSGMARRAGDAYCYAPGSAVLGARIDQLADLFARHLVDVTVLIHSSLDRKAQQFANAFKWRKDS